MCLGKRNKLRVYYLSWLRNKILHNDPEVEKKQGWTTVGDMEGCVHYRVGKWLCPKGKGVPRGRPVCTGPSGTLQGKIKFWIFKNKFSFED